MEAEEDKLKNLLSSVLDMFNERDVSPEDGALISANLLATALSHIDPAVAEGLIIDLLKTNVQSTKFRSTNRPFTAIGMDRGWGLDPALVEEEH